MTGFLSRRLSKLEAGLAKAGPADGLVRRFVVRGHTEQTAADFLTLCGHDLSGPGMVIIRKIVAASPDRGMLSEPYVDLTAKYGRRDLLRQVERGPT